MLDIRGVVLAAGHGTRMTPITGVVPKELVPMGRVAVIHRVISEGIEAGIRIFAVVIRSGKETIQRYIEQTLGGQAQFEFVYQEPQRGVVSLAAAVQTERKPEEQAQTLETKA